MVRGVHAREARVSVVRVSGREVRRDGHAMRAHARRICWLNFDAACNTARVTFLSGGASDWRMSAFIREEPSAEGITCEPPRLSSKAAGV